MQAIIFKIDRLNTHNGPGFRTVIYFKGCPLHCSWCHNPEGISAKKEVWWNSVKCIGCGTCVEMCPEQALVLDNRGITIDRQKCTGCQLCTMVCPSSAMEKIGEDYSVDDLMKIILQDKFLFESSGGGITVTGGEPGSQAKFVAELFQQCKAKGIHTAFDTSGMVSEQALAKIIPFTDLVFLDLKIQDNEKSLQHTGLPFEKLMKTISWLRAYHNAHRSLKIEIRTPLIPGITNSNEQLIEFSEFIKTNIPEAQDWEWCMFNDLCEDKYNKMGMHWTLKGQRHTHSDYSRLQALQEKLDLNIAITGFIDKKFDK